ncbi:tyrosine-type recombinase/integrase [uncultured Duncaniella sp.]|uniref:tyrosine-type recombinase/integrase n=1 Tax=uncultured Duncaniella sp. TaxID=2768039 RepID=UPI0026DF3F8D|nr:tyrosine-type recombinase/integrase [uncultured Duncaniella sp.]
MAKINVRDRNKNKPDKKPNWEYRFEAARINGKRKHISKAGFATKKEALNAGAIALATYENAGKVFVPSELSVADYLNYWIEKYAEMNLADATVAAYKNIIKNHIVPRIGGYKLKSIDTTTLQDMVNDIYVTRGFTRVFMNNIIKVLKGAFKYAKSTAKFIQDNPALDVSLPKGALLEPHKKTQYISKEAFTRLLERFKNSPYQYYALLISYFTGLRVSEVYGLTWDCIDLENRILIVNKAAKKIDGFDGNRNNTRAGGIRGHAHTKWYLGACKTLSSYRTINISEYLTNELKEYKASQEKNEVEYGDLYIKHYLKEETTKSNRKVYRIVSMDDSFGVEIPLPRVHLVMVKENGEFHGTDSMKYPAKIAKYELGIDFRFHALRHTHGTMLYENGVAVKDIQERLGHSTFSMTMDTYVENTKLIQDTTSKIIDDNIKIEIDKTPTNKRLHGIWLSVVNRCKTNEFYVRNNIVLCDEWQEFKPFESWAFSAGYQDDLYLSRRDKNVGYSPENCYWATLHEVKSNHQ